VLTGSEMKKHSPLGFLLIVLAVCGLAAAQDNKATPDPESSDRGKKNSRPAPKPSIDLHHAEPQKTAGPPEYFYEFVRTGFTYSPVRIEHDDDGLGKISFLKDGSDELITDPVALSPVTMDKIRDTLKALDFLNSSENYQYERDYSHLGNASITVRKGGKERTVKYNWTENKRAKELTDEYRRIANEYTWMFEFGVARENQPLRTPGMMDALDSYLQRNEIPDPPHLIPFLTKLSTDERLPLMARNHAVKLIRKIEKSSK
jgi:hypothetical protein